jgi:hypothetical protein
MHSQLMFNECIARSIKNDVHNSPSTIFQCVHRPDSKYWFGFDVVKGSKLSYLPASDTEKEAQNVGLLLLVQFLNIFEGSHLEINRLALKKRLGELSKYGSSGSEQ